MTPPIPPIKLEVEFKPKDPLGPESLNICDESFVVASFEADEQHAATGEFSAETHKLAWLFAASPKLLEFVEWVAIRHDVNWLVADKARRLIALAKGAEVSVSYAGDITEGGAS